ncbi:MAG: DUF4156 domain-containing protein [Pseudomonadales bacterium]|nr:DUF4156 domain-containing protein [Halioglobus sp.]MCP5128842.1 DUF4156 domain-containing protein [Pseudomonadales bacterium]
MKTFVLLIGLLALVSCTWVEPSEQGKAVTLVKSSHVSNCQSLGTVTSSTKDTVGFVDRSEEKVAGELLDLARNKAASMGGDTIVAEGQPEGGSQTFRVYKCG